jgi:hypothetical protein
MADPCATRWNETSNYYAVGYRDEQEAHPFDSFRFASVPQGRLHTGSACSADGDSARQTTAQNQVPTEPAAVARAAPVSGAFAGAVALSSAGDRIISLQASR